MQGTFSKKLKEHRLCLPCIIVKNGHHRIRLLCKGARRVSRDQSQRLVKSTSTFQKLKKIKESNWKTLKPAEWAHVGAMYHSIGNNAFSTLTLKLNFINERNTRILKSIKQSNTPSRGFY